MNKIIKRAVVKRNAQLMKQRELEKAKAIYQDGSVSLSRRLRAALVRLGIPEHRVDNQQPL